MLTRVLTISRSPAGAPGVALHGGPYPSKTTGKVDPVPRSFSVFDEIKPQAGPFDRLVWTPLSKSSASHYFSGDKLERAMSEQIFAIESPHGDQGYPGHLRVEARFALLKPTSSAAAGSKKSVGSIHLEYRAAILNGDQVAATPFNITHHWGFNLSASSLKPEAVKEGGTILQHRFRFVPPKSGGGMKLLGLDDKMLPTGELISIAKDDEHDFDLNGGKKFGENMPAGGYDHYYHWGQKDASNERVHLSSDTTGLELSFKTNQTGTQLYTTSGQPPFPVAADKTGGAKKKIHSPQRAVAGEEDAWKQQGNGQFCCAMLEFGAPHGIFLHESLQKANDGGKEDGLLRKGQTYANFVEMEVLVNSS